MNLSRLKSKLRLFYNTFIASPKQWRFPRKSEILIYDACGAETMAPYLTGYSVEILPLRGELVNIPCLLRAILKLSFWKIKPIQAYTEVFIKIVSPKLVITFIDNNVGFYTISNRFPDIKTIFLQNGTRGEKGDIFDGLIRSYDYHVDYMLVHGAAIGRHYSKYISGEVIAIGSLKNNASKKSSDIAVGAIVFISQYHDKPEGNAPFWVEPDGTPVYWDNFFAVESEVLNFLCRWCLENRKLLRICGRGLDNDGCEKRFYAANLKSSEWEYIPRSDSNSSYKLVDESEIVVFIDSTLGYEAIGRGKKAAGFSWRGASLSCPSARFGWPGDFPDNGPFWTNVADERQLRRVMDYLNTVSDEEWEKTRQLYANELMKFDAANTHFTALLDQLLPISGKFNYAH